jgi:hypothetical protein
MKIRPVRAIAFVGALAALGLSAAPGLSSGGPNTVTAVTHSSDHPDTTSVTGTCTGTSDNGPTWANDNLSLRFTVTPESGPGNYSVTITAHGSFDAFADPTTGGCYTGHGGVDGTLQWDVQSSTRPDPASLPSQVPGDLSQSAILNLLFDGNATIVGGGHYSYTYTQVNGSKYTQVG